MSRTLIAGFGNVLRGDDGFGVDVIRRLQREQLGDEVRLLDVGIGGIHLAHELLEGYDRAVIVDTMTRGGAPGTLYTLEVTDVEPDHRIDLHLVRPGPALGMAKALGVLPPCVLMIGCEPDRATLHDFTMELSPSVAAAVETAVTEIAGILSRSRNHV